MSTASLARHAYETSAHVAPTPKTIEADAFKRVTTLLQNSRHGGASSYRDTVEAVYLNKRLWSLIASDLAEDGNLLPQDLKVGLLNLAVFTETQCKQVLDGTGSVDAMIEINRAVLKGLKSTGAAK